jgi:hypothetical protein
VPPTGPSASDKRERDKSRHQDDSGTGWQFGAERQDETGIARHERARARSGNHPGYVASREKALSFARFNLNRRMMNTKAVRDTLCIGWEVGYRGGRQSVKL